MSVLSYIYMAVGALAMLALAHLYNETIDNPHVRRQALSGYVLSSERDAVQAQLDRERELRTAADQSLATASKRADDATKAKQAAEAEIDRLAEEAAKDANLSRPNESDKKWLSDR
ncbi:hypothetical protein ABVB72_02290 [Rhizobium nepotum]|uniref:hypothetical protein n=1 Tax=Rhizobium nepotum TaxID=1035271 RepID=UPI003369E419